MSTAPLILRPYQTNSIADVKAHFSAGRNRVVFVAPVGSGKCLGLDEPVLLFDGTVYRASDIRTGDLLMGPDSLPRRVLSTCKGKGPLFRINPIKGRSWICNDAHVLTIVETVSGKIEDIPLNEYLKRSAWYKSERKLFTPTNGVEFSPQPTPPIDPYFLGLWFGDGAKSTNHLGLIAISISKPGAKWSPKIAVNSATAKLR